MAKAAHDEGEEHGRERADAAAFRGREHAGVDAPDDHDEDDNDGQAGLERNEPFMHGHAGQGGGQLGIAPDHDHDDDDETGHAHEAGEHAGDEQVGDALFRKDAVDDEIRARRDEAADAAGTGQRPDGQLVVIAVPPHFGQGCLTSSSGMGFVFLHSG